MDALACLPCGLVVLRKTLRGGALFLISKASVLSAAALTFVLFCVMTRLFSDSGEER